MSIDAAGLSEFSEFLPRITTSVIRRPRLHELLNTTSPLTVIAAPHGYGKTTLLVSWLEESTPANSGAAVHWWDGSRFQRPLSFAEKIQSLRHDLLTARKPTVVVIDRFDEASPDADELLLELVRDFRSLRLIISLQSAERVSTWHAYDLDPKFITGAQLRFTREETQATLQRNFPDAPGTYDHEVHDAVGGWPVLVQAAAAGNGIGAAAAYLRDKLQFSAAHSDLISFVKSTNCGVDFPASHAKYLTQRTDVDSLISKLSSVGVLHKVLGSGDEPRYSYIEVIQQFVTGDEAKERASETISDLAHWCAKNEDFTSAIRYFAHIKAWEEIDRILETHGYRIAEIPEVLHILESIDPTEILDFPVLATIKDFISGPRHRSGRLPDSFKKTPDSENNDLFQACVRAGYLRFNGKYAQSARGFSAVRAELKNAPLRSVEELGTVAAIRLQIALDDLFADNLETATREAIQAYRMAGEARLDSFERNAAGLLALLALFSGNGQGVATWLTREKPVAHAEDFFEEMIKTAGLVAGGLMHLGALETPEAQTLIAQCNDVTALDEMWPFTAYLKAEQALLTGRFAQGLRDIETATTAHPSTYVPKTLNFTLLTAARSNLLLALGDGPRAQAELARADTDHPMIRAVLARSMLLAGEYPEVIAVARRHSEKEQIHDRAARELRLLAAVAEFELGDTKSAFRSFSKFLNDDGVGLLRALALVPQPLIEQMTAKLGIGQEEFSTVRSRVSMPVFDKPTVSVTLTPRETMVLQLLQQGLSIPEVAETLVVSINTVKSQSRSLYRKLGVNSRARALARAVEYGLLP